MRVSFLFAVIFSVVLLLAGCGGEQSAAPVEQAAEDAAAQAAAAEPVDMNELLASADVKRGQTLYMQCRACHSLEQGGPNKVGPNLYGMFGRKAGLAEGFDYSDAMADSEVVWTPETMSPWLEQPSRYMPGNRMVFVGVRDAEDRANLIAYLLEETGAN